MSTVNRAHMAMTGVASSCCSIGLPCASAQLPVRFDSYRLHGAKKLFGNYGTILWLAKSHAPRQPQHKVGYQSCRPLALKEGRSRPWPDAFRRRTSRRCCLSLFSLQSCAISRSIQFHSILSPSCTSSCFWSTICSILSRNRSSSSAAFGFFYCIVPSAATTESWLVIRRNPRI